MFTGIVEELGTVTQVDELGDAIRLTVEAHTVLDDVHLGDSIAVNGCCLTVVSTDGPTWTADVMQETLDKTSLAGVAVGDRVNLERAVTADKRMGGHFVQGHVDAVGTLVNLRADQDFYWLTVRFPESLARYMVPKGSVTVDGISLTIARLGTDEFDVQLVPFTMGHTNLQRAKAGDPVNLECDMIGKYVARAMDLFGTRAVSPEPTA